MFLERGKMEITDFVDKGEESSIQEDSNNEGTDDNI